MSKNEKASILGGMQGLIKSLMQSNIKLFYPKNQDLCSFCRGEMSDDSIRFKGIGACPKCFRLSHIFVDSLRRCRREYSKRFGVKKK